MAGLNFLLPRSKRGLVWLAFLVALAALRLVGEQGARIGPFLCPEIEFRWLLIPAVAGLFLVPPSASPLSLSRLAGVGLALVLSAWPLSLWREQAKRPVSPLTATIYRFTQNGLEPEGMAPLPTLRLESRKYLSRLAGRRRGFAVEASGFLRVVRQGTYRFELASDDRSSVVLNEKKILEGTGSVSVDLSLAEGLHRFSLRYEQAGGPAFLILTWNGPPFFEFLPLEHYLSSQADLLSREALRSKEKEAVISFVLALGWWAAGLCLVVRAGERRRAWIVRLSEARRILKWVPPVSAAFLITYGALLRFEALLVRSRLAEESPAAQAIHKKLVPLLPGYGVFHPWNFRESPYRADVRSYLDRARSLTWGSFYQPSFREPFYVLLVRGFLALAGGQEFGILVGSFCFSVATLPLAFLLARRMAGPWLALAVLIPLVFHQWLVMESATGYRESAYAFLLLAFAGWVFLESKTLSRLHAAMAGLLGAMVCLVRLSGLSFVLPLLGLAAWEKRKEGGGIYATISALVLALAIGPFLLSCYLAHGDPFYAVSFHTRFWLNAEGKGKQIQGPVGVYRYLVELHEPEELLRGSARGLTVLPLRTFWSGLAQYSLLDVLVLAGGSAGLLLSLASGPRFLVVAYFGHLIPFAFIQNFPSGQMPRFVMPAYFFLVLAAGAMARRIADSVPSGRPSSEIRL